MFTGIMPLLPMIGMPPTEFMATACGMSTIMNVPNDVDRNYCNRVAIDDFPRWIGGFDLGQSEMERRVGSATGLSSRDRRC